MASIRPLALVRLDARQAQALRRLGGQFEGLEVTGLLADPTSVRMRLSPLALAEREAAKDRDRLLQAKGDDANNATERIVEIRKTVSGS